MKTLNSRLCAIILTAGLLFVGSVISGQSQLTGTYTQTFANGGNTSDFANSGSVAGWFYWYGFYGNEGVTNDVDMDVANDSTSGSVEVYLPFGAGGSQQTIVGS